MRARQLILTCLVPMFATASADQPASFVRDIAPIFAAKCLTCHNKEKLKGGYDMETFETLMRAGDSEEPPVVPHHPEKSKIVELLTTKDEDDRMPQKSEPLPPGQIALIQTWIREGARIDDGAQPVPVSNVPLHTLIATAHPPPPESYSRPVPIRALAFDRDGSELAAGGYHEVTFWRTEDGKLLRRIPNMAQQVYGIAYSPNGKLLAVASGTPGKLGQINLLHPAGSDPAQSLPEADRGQPLPDGPDRGKPLPGGSDRGQLVPAARNNAGQVLGTARDAMLAVCFSPDGDRLAVGGADNTIRVYDVETGKQELLIEQHADWVLGLSFNNDASLLVSASRDKTARVFNTTNGELESTYVGHNDAIFAVAFGPDGTRVCSAGRDKTLHLWDVKDAKKSDEAKGFDEEVLRLIAGSNSVFSCSADKKLRRHSLAKKLEMVRTFTGHEDVVYALALHEPTGRLASGSFDGQVRIWDVESGDTVISFVAAPGAKVVRSVTSGK